MNNTIWINHYDNNESPPFKMTMTNQSHSHYPPAVSTSTPTSANESTESATMIIIFLAIIACLFILALACHMQRPYRQESRREQGKTLEDTKVQEKLRIHLIQHMTQKKLIMTLTSLDVWADGDTSKVFDIEHGMSRETTRDETSSVKFEKELSAESIQIGVAVDQSVSVNYNNHVDLRLENTMEKKTKRQGLEISNEETPNLAGNLEAGMWNIANKSETGSTTSTKENLNSLQNSCKSRRSTNGSSIQSEIFVTKTENILSIRNVCAICLECYSPGDTIVWSNNILCKHVFHQNCILDYLVQKKEQETPCPCCRQVFLPKDQ